MVVSYFDSLRHLGALAVSAVSDFPAHINRRGAEDTEAAQRRNVKLGCYLFNYLFAAI